MPGPSKNQRLAVPSVPVTVLGSGSAVVGQALGTELTREEALQILMEGLLPIAPANARIWCARR